MGYLEFVHQEFILGEPVVGLHVVSLPVLLLCQGTVHLIFAFSADSHEQWPIENRLAAFGVEHLHVQHTTVYLSSRPPPWCGRAGRSIAGCR